MGPQKHGIVVCIPKADSPSTLADYRPITLLNTDYKILARIVANRLRATLSEVLHRSQDCGLPGNTIFDAVATMLDAIAYAELTHAPLCILSLDLTTAFDRISHMYLFRMLQSYGYSARFIALIKAMYDQAFSSVQINGHFVEPFPVRCSVRQGCPMSMLLFALILKPSLCLLEHNLTGIRIGHRTQKTAVVANAEDVTIFVTEPNDIKVIRDLLLTYERATGAYSNIRKSKAYKCEIAQNQVCGHRKLHTVRETRYHVTLPHRKRGTKRGLGMDPPQMARIQRTDPRRLPTD
jgi:hypothetical protein